MGWLCSRFWVRAGAFVAACFGACVLALLVAVAREPLPEALERTPQPSLRILDRGGRLLREMRSSDGRRSAPVRLDELSPFVVPALVAAEDRRFFSHPGVDPLAMARALGSLVVERRVVSGASTITQQLARHVAPRPRTLAGKLREVVVALRIERELDKSRILEEYLARVEFGPNVRGIEAASLYYFDKPARALDLAEASVLVAVLRGPSFYDPRRHAERLERRRKRVLERLRELGGVEETRIERALQQRPLLRSGERGSLPNQLLVALASGRLAPELGRAGSVASLQTTIDGELQSEVETLTQRAVARLGDKDVSSASVIVLDNQTSDVLAYVGSPDFDAPAALGQNDGVRARRQPGSTLKPFLYALALAEGGMTPATVLPDLPLALPTEHGTFAPRNYDRHYHGPVSLRVALGSSLNVPAVFVANQLGVERVLGSLRRAGFTSLSGSAPHYGTALVLGDGEVTLRELARAYAMLARGGELVRERFATALIDAEGARRELAPSPPERVLDPRVVALVTDILRDSEARAHAFGRESMLELPFPVAVKTGTSKGYRDNWTLGYTREVTVGVWVGNFDGSPMVRSSGVTGAAPLFRDVMLAAMRGRQPAPLVERGGLVAVEVCAASGALPHAECPHRRTESFLTEHVPHASCSLHERVLVDGEAGGLAADGCPGTRSVLVERYASEYAAWAKSAGRPLAPAHVSPRCPSAALARVSGESRVNLEYPHDGSHFRVDPDAGRQELVFRARAEPGARVTFALDGRVLGSVEAPFRWVWPLERGQHRLTAKSGAGAVASVSFRVD